MAKRTALRQREWVIMIRPYHTKGNITIWYDGVPKAGSNTDLGATSGTDTPTALKGIGEGMEATSKMQYDKGGWVIWYKTNSFNKLRLKYKEILADTGSDNIRVMEILPVDTLVTPLT